MEDTNTIIGFLEEKNYLSSTFQRYMKRVQELYEKTELCHKMIIEYDDISNEELYKRLKLLEMNSYLVDEEYYNIMDMVNEKKYFGPTEILTNMDEYINEMDEEDKEVKSLIGVKFLVIYNNVKLKPQYRYNKDKINEMLEKKEIVILKKLEGSPSYQRKECPKYEEILTSSRDLFEKEDGKYHKDMLNYIRKEITKEKLREMLDILLTKLKEEVGIMEDAITEFNDKGYQKKISILEK